MAISTPKLAFSKEDRRLLWLLGRLLAESAAGRSGGSNAKSGEAPLTDAEFRELVTLVCQFVDGSQFQESRELVEGVADLTYRSSSELRKVYVGGYVRRGKSRAMMSTRWLEYLKRLGKPSTEHLSPSVEPMTYRLFMSMEEKLLLQADVGLDATYIILDLLASQRNAVAQVLREERKLPTIGMRQAVFGPLLKAAKTGSALTRNLSPPMSRERLAAIATVVADVSVIFTTRDWDAAGTISAIAGASMIAFAGDADAR